MSNSREKAKVVLIIPNTRWLDKRPRIIIPYAALILTDLLKDEFDFSIVDANGGNLSGDECLDRVLKINPDIVLVTSGSVEYHKQAHKACSIAKSLPATTTILGGVYPTTLPEEAIKDKNIDWLFLHHAEERINDFLNLVLAGRINEARDFPGIAYRDSTGEFAKNPPSQYIGDVKTMAKPDYSLIDLTPYLDQKTKDYQTNSLKPSACIFTSYGCPYDCVFCASRTICGHRMAYRPAGDVLAEIDYLVKEHAVGHVVFHDDAMLVNREHIETILKGIIERKYDLAWTASAVHAWLLDDDLLALMKKSGCVQITVSVESGSRRVLKEIINKPLKLEIVPPLVKKCREIGIIIGANFVIGFPGETWDEIRQTFRFAEKCDFDIATFTIATPLPQTDLYRICKEAGYLAEDFSFTDPKFFGFGTGHITTEEFTPFELGVLRAFEWDRINFSTPEKIERMGKLFLMTRQELDEFRRQTRRKLGIHY